MNIQEIKDLINSSTYEFLRTDEHLGNHIMLMTLGGSYAYGTNIEGSDLDIRGIAMERRQEILGLSNFEQFENKKTDTVIYGFKKIVNLLINCNPNVIEILGTKPEHIFAITDEGKMLRNHVNLFLSRKVAHSFGGYANQQLRRLQNAFQIEDGIQFSGVQRSFDDIIKQLTSVSRQLNKRNNKKDEKHMNKHIMHLVRLFLMGIEILEGKGINTYRENDREMLLKIRNNEYSYEEIFQMVDEYNKKFIYAKDNTPLLANPNMKKIEEIVMTINERSLKI